MKTAPQLAIDIKQLSQLKAKGPTDSRQELERVAREFESIYLKMMLDSMRKAERVWAEDNPLSSREVEFFQDMLDGQLASNISASNSVGLADMLVRQLGRFVDEPATAQVEARDQVMPSTGSKALSSVTSGSSHALTEHGLQASLKTQIQHQVAISPDDAEISFAGKPQAFVQALWPHAQRAGQALGVEPKIILAQAALETGWGQSLTRAEHGWNLFGIKANQSWQGGQQLHPTHEVYNGQIIREQAAFRSYDSPQASFDDYVALMKTNRYQEAMGAKSGQHYLQALAQAGYATDPAYANKVLSIANSDRFNSLLPNVARQ